MARVVTADYGKQPRGDLRQQRDDAMAKVEQLQKKLDAANQHIKTLQDEIAKWRES